MNDLWWHGLEWLLKSISEWPIDKADETENDKYSYLETESEQKSECEGLSLSVNQDKSKEKCFQASAPFEMDCHRYLSITKLLRITAILKCFIGKLKGEKNTSLTFTSTDINDAEKMWILHVQQKYLRKK